MLFDAAEPDDPPDPRRRRCRCGCVCVCSCGWPSVSKLKARAAPPPTFSASPPFAACKLKRLLSPPLSAVGDGGTNMGTKLVAAACWLVLPYLCLDLPLCELCDLCWIAASAAAASVTSGTAAAAASIARNRAGVLRLARRTIPWPSSRRRSCSTTSLAASRLIFA